MPSVLRISGPGFIRNGVLLTPRALVSTCETCGADAPFGIRRGDKLLTYCGYRNGEPVCIGKGKERAA